MNNIILPEDILKEAIIKACEEENAAYTQLASSENANIFSDKHAQKTYRNARLFELADLRPSRYKKNIKKLYQKEKNSRKNDMKKADIIEYPLKRVPKKSLRIKIALIAIIIMMFGSMTVFAVEPLREKVYKIIETLFPDHTDISFEEVPKETEEDGTDSQTRNFNPNDFPKKLKWVPEGFILTQEDVDVDFFSLWQFFVYTNPQGEWQQIDYEQVAMENSSGWSFTSDGTPAKEIYICEEKGTIYADEGGYLNIIVKKNGFAYYIGGNVKVEILTKCLESAFEKE